MKEQFCKRPEISKITWRIGGIQCREEAVKSISGKAQARGSRGDLCSQLVAMLRAELLPALQSLLLCGQRGQIGYGRVAGGNETIREPCVQSGLQLLALCRNIRPIGAFIYDICRVVTAVATGERSEISNVVPLLRGHIVDIRQVGVERH